MSYKPPFFLFNKHLETIYPSLVRSVDFSFKDKVRIPTPDRDFLDIQLSSQQSTKLIIISHGLEGNSDRAYIKGMAKVFFDRGFDVLAWNYRGCGDEMNKQLRFYHSGATDDLDVVVEYAVNLNKYASINLIGFSLGGNITLKYLGENVEHAKKISKAVAISVPMDLGASCAKISEPSNRIYHHRFLKSLKNKIITKSLLMKGLDTTDIASIKTLKDFDDRYTAPLHGYKDALEYYNTCSSVRFVKNIQIPTLIVNALNDPFLSPECYPVGLLKDHPFVKLETPKHGGHVGFYQINSDHIYYSEERALSFLN